MIDSKALSYYQSSVGETRNSFRQSLRCLPGGFREVALQSFQQRCDRSGNSLMLGEYSPWIVGDLVGTDPQRLSLVALGWMHIYLSILMLDDLIDEPEVVNNDKRQASMIVVPLLLQQGLCRLAEVLPSTKLAKLHQELGRAFSETASAALHEITAHRSKITTYSEISLEQVANKLAMLKICTVAVTSCDPQYKSEEELGAFLNSLSLAIQLLDDLADVHEDFRQGNFTLPLTEVVSRGYLAKASGNHRIIGNDELLALLIKSGALEKSLDVILWALGKALMQLDMLESGRGGRVRSFVSDLSTNCRELASVSASIRHAWPDVGDPISVPWTSWANEQDLAKVTERLRLVAQSS